MHLRSIDRSVRDLPTTMSKRLAAAPGFAPVLRAVSCTPAEVTGLGLEAMAAGKTLAAPTIFDLKTASLEVVDAPGGRSAVADPRAGPCHRRLGYPCRIARQACIGRGGERADGYSCR